MRARLDKEEAALEGPEQETSALDTTWIPTGMAGKSLFCKIKVYWTLLWALVGWENSPTAFDVKQTMNMCEIRDADFRSPSFKKHTLEFLRATHFLSVWIKSICLCLVPNFWLCLCSHSRAWCSVSPFWKSNLLFMLLIKNNRNQTSVWKVYDPKATRMHRRKAKVIMDAVVYGFILKLFSNRRSIVTR